MLNKLNFIPVVKHSLKYNPSIDGLRGISISLVFLFHIWPEYFSFGYVGVDIFFLLSGYLITQIIYNKQYKNIRLKETKNFHDRFLIIDNSEIYYIGASIKDLGNKVFAFSKLNIDINSFELLKELN